MALSANRQVDHLLDQELREFSVKGNVHVYKGALVGFDSGGYARPLVAADVFAGIAYEEVDNTGGSDGDKKVRVYTEGDFILPLTSASLANNGVAVAASDDATLTYTTSGNTTIGKQVGVPAANQTLVRIAAF